mgnify:CR=1 FL=1
MRQRNRQAIAVLVSVVLFLFAFLTGCGQAKKEDQEKETKSTQFKPLDTKINRIVAEYPGGRISEGDLNRYLNILAFLDMQVSMMLSDPGMKKQLNDFKRIILKGYAAELVIAKEVKREDEFRKRALKEIQQLEKSLKENPLLGGPKVPKNLDEALKGKGFTRKDLEEFIVRSLQRNEYFKSQLKSLKYDKVKANHILIAYQLDAEGKKKRSDAEAKKRAEEVKKKLEQNGDFKKLAKEYSDDPGSKNNGGVIEGSADQFVPEFASAVRTLPLNKISDPIKTEYGYHIVKVTERSKEDYEKASEEIKQQKMQQLNQEYIDKKLKVKILLPEEKAKKKK